VVRLRESERFTIRYGIGYQEREKLRGILEFSDLNILGLARRADIRLRGSSKAQEAVFNLRQTQFHPLPVDSYLSFSASYRQQDYGDIRRLSASYQFSRPINNHSWAMFRYNFKNVHVISDKSIVGPTGGTPGEDLEREDTPVNLSTFSVAYINDSRDNYLDPTVGFFSSSEFGVTSKILGEKDYVSFFTQNSYFRKLPKSFMAAASLRIGLIHPYGGSDVPISERYFAGGASSLRGFDTDFAGPLDVKQISESESVFTPKGGNALFIASVELRRPVLSFLHLAGFYDTGNVFETIQDFRLTGFSHTLGAGLRIKTPLGPLRLDYGYNLNLDSSLEYPGQSIQGLDRGHFFLTVGPPF
jgi:outer membrane protein insertion porin family